MKTLGYRESLSNKKILVVGLGKSGMATVDVLLGLGSKVSVQDTRSDDKFEASYLTYLANNSVEMYLGSKPNDTKFDIFVLSPGVPTDLDFIVKAKLDGTEIIGELELAYRLTEGRYVAITGTNGKTTTTTLVGEIFKASNSDVKVVGNIGNPVVTEAINSQEDTWMVAEVSSFQLETVSEFRPIVSAILNLTPDHLNRHKTMEAYGKAKAQIFAKQTAEDYVVINYDDKLCYSLLKNCEATVIPFSRKEKLEQGAYLDGETLVVKRDGAVHEICKASNLKIIGDHNIENVLAAVAISYWAGIELEVISKAVKEFPGVEHRIEFCGEINGTKYYNDSKGTNVDASIIALKALKQNIILIAGGDGKSQDFTDLAKHLTGTVKALVLIGRDANIIEKAAREQGFETIYNVSDMVAAVRKCYELSESGDNILLSPACASWDMYKNYEIRGEDFKNCVQKIKES